MNKIKAYIKKVLCAALIVVLAAGMLSGCSAGGNFSSSPSSGPTAPTAPMAPPPTAGEVGAPSPSPSPPKGGYDSVAGDGSAIREEMGNVGGSLPDMGGKKLIITAALDMESIEFDKALTALSELVSSAGGYFESSNIYDGGYYAYASSPSSRSRTASYVVRIPADRHSFFMSGAEGIAHVVNTSSNSRDVSEQYFDIEARLSTLRIKQDRLTALLEKADKMEDIITIENSLAEVLYEIESYTTSLRKLDAQIDYTSINVNIREVYRLTDVETTPESFIDRVKKATFFGFNSFVDSGEDFLVDLAYGLPWLIVLAVIVAVFVLIIRGLIRKGRRDKRRPPVANYSDTPAPPAPPKEDKE